ncbi:hypothetical protein [Virgibacillus pantothenticus]|uniref:hypothetical protein n=1 Tax=Virgibacillus pantothenticus TaxID=1473 RepID=UPI0009853C32|nr:hypothetical protein [Virgibacillus pantothenticus]
MGIDYLVCEVCGEGFPDVMEYGFCGNCEATLCEDCFADMQVKYGEIGEDHEQACNVGEFAPNKCDECTKPKIDTKKFETFMYYLAKDEVKPEFLKRADLTLEDYESIKKYLEFTYGINMYL